MNDDLTDVYQEVILKHAKSPQELPGPKHHANRLADGLLALPFAP